MCTFRVCFSKLLVSKLAVSSSVESCVDVLCVFFVYVLLTNGVRRGSEIPCPPLLPLFCSPLSFTVAPGAPIYSPQGLELEGTRCPFAREATGTEMAADFAPLDDMLDRFAAAAAAAAAPAPAPAPPLDRGVPKP